MRLNSSKVQNLSSYINYANTNYDTLKEKFGSGRYDFLIKIDGFTGGEIGKSPLNPTGLITIKRPVIYNDAPSILSVTLWMNYTT